MVNFFEVSEILTKLDRAYNNAESYEFKKIWLDHWNAIARQTNGEIGLRDIKQELH